MAENGSLFATVIQDHLELKRRNSTLDPNLPLNEFMGEDPFTNHPLFKTEEDARREEQETGEHPVVALGEHPRSPRVPADTLAMPVVADEDDEEVEAHSWMETTTDPDFRWE